jgi:hypothetical protein
MCTNNSCHEMRSHVRVLYHALLAEPQQEDPCKPCVHVLCVYGYTYHIYLHADARIARQYVDTCTCLNTSCTYAKHCYDEMDAGRTVSFSHSCSKYPFSLMTCSSVSITLFSFSERRVSATPMKGLIDSYRYLRMHVHHSTSTYTYIRSTQSLLPASYSTGICM